MDSKEKEIQDQQPEVKRDSEPDPFLYWLLMEQMEHG